MAVIVFMTAALVLSSSCSKNKTPITDSVFDKLTPELASDSITTIVSDSGIIRYRIKAEHWNVYDKADTPYWDFPKGLRFERFNESYDIDAEIEAQRAIYYSELEVWKLNDSVRAMNLNGEKFETEELYWDQKLEKVYSDSSIVIIQSDKKIIGVGFESNQTFTRYTILQPKGTLPIDSD
ncbi:MAG: LPS export ABC transporter periplasmic protein LptC [bacterium]